MKLPAALVPPPIRSSDLLAEDAPAQPLGTPWYRGAGARIGYFFLLAVGVSLPVAAPLYFFPQFANSMAALSALQLVVVVAAYLILVLAIERRRPPLELAPGRWSGLLYGLGLGAVLFAVCFAAIAVLGGYRFEGVDGAYSWVTPVFILGVGAGVSEELLFRGVLFRLGEQLLGTWFSALLSGLIFGFMHLGNKDATIVGAAAIAIEAGLMFAFLYALTRSLWLCIGVHAAWNVMQGPVLGVPVSGSGLGDGWLNTVAVGPDWLTGGAFGAESSLVTVVILVAFTLWLARRLHLSGQVVEPSWSRRTELRDRLRAQA